MKPNTVLYALITALATLVLALALLAAAALGRRLERRRAFLIERGTS